MAPRKIQPVLLILFSFFVVLFSKGQEVKEQRLVLFPKKSSEANSGKKIMTIIPPADWEYSDTALITLIKTLNPSEDPYYLISANDIQHYYGTVIKTEVASRVFQYTITENFPDGSVKRIDVLNERGKKNGIHYEYWKPGVLKVNGGYVNGKRDGMWENFDSLGRITSSMRFLNGDAEVPKLVSKPHKTYYSAVVAPVPVRPYKIDPGPALELKWDILESDYAQIWSFQGGIGYMFTPKLDNLNYGSMLGLPNGEHFSMHYSLTFWDPAEFFGEVEWKTWVMAYKKGQYQSSNVKAGVTGTFVTFSFGHGIYKRNRSILSGSLGMTLSSADLTSKDLDNSKGTSESWFELSSLKQGPMLSPALLYDLRFPFQGKFTPGLSVKVGYHIPLGSAKWHLLDSPLKNRETVDLGGLFISAALKINRLRRV